MPFLELLFKAELHLEAGEGLDFFNQEKQGNKLVKLSEVRMATAERHNLS